MTRPYRLPTAVLVATCILSAVALAQEVGATREPLQVPVEPDDTITTVAPVMVPGLAPIPQVGTGASWFDPDDVREIAQRARMDQIDARAATRQCHVRGAPQSEDIGDFSLEALYDTESKAQAWLNESGDTAAAAIEASLEARRAVTRGEPANLEVTELARQRAILNFQAAQAGVREAQRRIADLQDLYETDDGEDRDLKPIVEARTLERKASTLPGGIYLPSVYKDLKIEEVVVREAQAGEDRAMLVRGVIVNPRKSAVLTPPLWVAALDRYGTAVKDQMMEAPPSAQRIAPGGRMAFTFQISPLPEKAARAIVTFAPFHHEPELRPVSAYCER